MKKIIKRILSTFNLELKRSSKNMQFAGKIFEKYREFTMIPKDIYIANLELVEEFRSIEGDIVECGVWKGGMIAGIAQVLGKNRHYHVFDSFQGLPKVQEIDGNAANEWQANTDGRHYFDNCSADEDYVRKLLEGYSYTLYKGWFHDTMPETNSLEKIAMLRLDADWYDSTFCCLKYLFHKVAQGGLIIIDDYYVWEGCSKAIHDFLSQTQNASNIYSANGIAYIIKK